VTVPLVALPKAKEPEVPDAPRVGVAVHEGFAPELPWNIVPLAGTAIPAIVVLVTQTPT
jgi:hypothetical protein